MVTEFFKGEKVKTINFEIVQGFILVDIKFQNIVPMKFIFDTGSTHTILFDKTITDIFRIDYAKKIEIYGADLEQNIYAYIARNISLTLDDKIKVVRDILVLEDDYLFLEEMTGIQIDGIIGGSFFRSMVVEILYNKNKLIFHEPNSFKADSSYGSPHDIMVYEDKPYINLNYQNHISEDKKKLKILIDTGAALTFLIHANSDSTIHLSPQITRGILGKGLGGDLTGYIGISAEIEFAGFRFRDLFTSYQDVSESILEKEQIFRNGLLGNNLLARFDITFDYMRRKMYLKPYSNYNKKFKYDKSGIIIFSYGNDLRQFYVKGVIPLSPADLAGVKKGDVIKKINFWGYKFWKLSSVNRLFQRRDGKKIKLVVERNGVKKKIEFKLKDYLLANQLKK